MPSELREGKVYFTRGNSYLIGPRGEFEPGDRVVLPTKDNLEVEVHSPFKGGIVNTEEKYRGTNEDGMMRAFPACVGCGEFHLPDPCENKEER